MNQLHGLAIGENVRYLAHRRIHYSPEIVIALGRCERYEGAPDAVLVGARVEIHAARMRRWIVEVRRGDLADAADRNCYVSVGGGAQLIEEIDVRHFPEKLIFGADRIATATGGDLQVKVTEQVAV